MGLQGRALDRESKVLPLYPSSCLLTFYPFRSVFSSRKLGHIFLFRVTDMKQVNISVTCQALHKRTVLEEEEEADGEQTLQVVGFPHTWGRYYSRSTA
jgi:hypothetical protein